MVQTYVENNVVAQLPQEYSEDALHLRFVEKMQSLHKELAEYQELRAELDKTNRETDWTDNTPENSRSAQHLLAQYAVLDREQKPLEQMYAQTQIYDNLLNEYGNEFAQLYRIKDNHETRGYVDEMSFVEVDITDNGDMLTQDQYFKMRADPDERLRELALHIELGDEDEEDGENSEGVGFNFGVMEFNQPNQPPQTKVQISFDDETLERLDEPKLKKIFAFCESHGISVADMEIRRFDGSLAETEIREKIEKILEKTQKEKEERNKEAGLKEAAEQEERRKTLDMELQNIRAAKGGVLPDGISWDNVSTDKVPENRRMAATNNPNMPPLTREFLRATPALSENGRNLQTEENAATGKFIPQEMNAEHGIEVGQTADKSVRLQTADKGGSLQSAGTDMNKTSGSEKVAAEEGKTVSAEQNVQGNEPTAMQSDAHESISQKVQRIAKGIATAALPDKKLQNILGKPAVRSMAENTSKADVVSTEADTRQPAEHKKQVSLDGTGNVSERLAALNQGQSAPQVPAPQTPPPPENPKISMKKIEQGFEDWLENDIKKVKGSSYFKRHTGWFGHGWTEYIIYDNEDPDNRKKDGMKQKDGSVKYTYSFKLFLKQDKDGNLHFAYRTPNHRKMDEAMIGDIVGKLKALGYTHINFPSGVPNAEKAMWRKAMAENGIVPIGMGLNRAKAEGMLKAAKEKLSTEAYAEYQYKLGLQMNRHNQEKGKSVDESEQAFIDGLINTHKYAAFTNAYTLVFKNKIKTLLREKNAETGAVDKTAAYRTLRKVFDVYKSAMEHGGSLMNADGLTDKEKQDIKQLGLDGSVEKLSTQQMDKLYDVLFGRQQKEAYNDIRDMLLKTQYGQNRGAKVADRILIKAAFDEARESCESINDDLTAMGIEEIKIIKVTNIPFDREFERYYTVDKPEYERTHPQPGKSLNGTGNGNSGSSKNLEEVQTEERNETKTGKKRKRHRNKNKPDAQDLYESDLKKIFDDSSLSRSEANTAAVDMLQKAVEKSKSGNGM
ncbi:MAG: hypothetical protein IJ738_05640 [Alphaproteobacteria bacterium]|nr:hypothetical protein [Alphaproteobacteria bacterium]MBR1757027.1 hypothetical protein [Alphaproteobacteria bacterium]